jgi:uncharacterized protein YqhQ
VRLPWLRTPVLRGSIVLYEALTLGIRALFLSASAAMGEETKLSPRQTADDGQVDAALLALREVLERERAIMSVP